MRVTFGMEVAEQAVVQIEKCDLDLPFSVQTVIRTLMRILAIAFVQMDITQIPE